MLVTPAEGTLGHLVVARILRFGGEVRAFCGRAGDPQALRAAGAIVATGDPLDEGHLEAALQDVHTVVHLAADPLRPDVRRIREEAACVVGAGVGARVQRLIVLSLIGADASAPDPLRSALGQVEQRVADAPVPSIVLRTSLVDTPELRDALAALRPRGEQLDTPVAPLRPADVAELIAAFDAARSEATAGHVVFAAEGAERMPLATYLARVGVLQQEGDGSGRLVGRVWRPESALALVRAALDGALVGEEPWVLDAFAFAGRSPRRLAAGAD